MYDCNVITITGRLTRDAEKRFTSGNKAKVNFAVANQPGGKDTGTTFFDCTLWERKGLDELAARLIKGTQVCVSGRVECREYQMKDGAKARAWGLTVMSISLFGSKIGQPKAESPF